MTVDPRELRLDEPLFTIAAPVAVTPFAWVCQLMSEALEQEAPELEAYVGNEDGAFQIWLRART